MNNPRLIELLAPARNAKTAIAAINHGADAVYIGAEGFGARAAAGNSIGDIKAVVEYAHRFHVKVYVTFNTLIYNNELDRAKELVTELYYAGVDALIVQDMALLEMDIPPIQLHASTQADARTPHKARFLQDAGFSQIVIPREMTLQEIREVAKAVTVPIEAFVHGALCVSYSGACRASFLANGRSANRGECAQMCRQLYTLENENGNMLMPPKHLLSLRDMNRMEYLLQMLEAGVSSFKIEGRLKDTAYVKNCVAAYSQRLNSIIAVSGGKYRRASIGRCEYGFTPDVAKSFNRGFTPYFMDTRQPASIAAMDTPKSIGEKIGKIVSVRGNRITISADTPVANGDGLGFFNRKGVFTGFRANRVEGNTIILREPIAGNPAGAELYRNRDSARDAILAREDTGIRFIGTDIEISILPDNSGLRITLSTDTTGKVAATLNTEIIQAEKPQNKDSRKKIISKLGDTIFRLGTFSDSVPESVFIPNSILATLRRKGIDALVSAIESRRPLSVAAPRNTTPAGASDETAENVANSLAENFYRKAGVTKIENAVETYTCKSVENHDDITVMECRYCLRRELDACRKNPEKARRLPDKLYIRTGSNHYRLDFDCKNCMMKITLPKS